MKAVVATSRMHEGSRRRTDSCEIPGSGASRQSSMQQDPPPDCTDATPDGQEALPPERQLSQEDDLSPSPSRSTKTGSDAPNPGRPPLRAEGLRQASVLPKPTLVPPRLPQKSFSVMDAALKVETTPTLVMPPSSSTFSNGFAPVVDTSTKTGPCQ